MTTTAQNPYYPQVDKSVDPKVTVHLQRIYPAINDHDKAIRGLKSQVDALKKTITTTTTTVTSSSSSSSSSGSGSTPSTSFPGLGYINPQPGITAYTVQQSDSGIELQLNDASPVAVTLDTTLNSPFFMFVTNLGTGLVTLTPNGGATINGAASFNVPKNSMSVVVLSNLLWYASAIQIVPQNTPAVPHEWLDSYDDTTGLFHASQPATGDLSDWTDSGVANGNVPVWNSGTSKWTPGVIALTGTSASLGGSAMTAGQTVTVNVTVAGATTAMVACTSPATYPGDGFVWDAYVSAANTVTVRLTAAIAATPVASAYNVRLLA